MASRTALVLILVGVVLLVGGTAFAVIFLNYTLLALPLASTRDVVLSAAVAAIGAVCVVVGIRNLCHACRQKAAAQQPAA